MNEAFVFIKEDRYDTNYRVIFSKMRKDGKLIGNYSDQKWKCYAGTKHFWLDFHIDHLCFLVQKTLKLKKEDVEDMLKCYVLSLCGEYIFPTLERKLFRLREFLQSYGNKNYSVKEEDLDLICNFLHFIYTPKETIHMIENSISLKKADLKHARKLSHLINYLAIANELDELYSGILPDEDFIHWFPLLFWTKVTFIIPLRATEMLLTPYDCIERVGHKVFLHLRRTKLKKKRHKVHYNVEEDYQEFVYPVPDNDIIQCIEKYQKLTDSQDRRFLFRHSKYMINKMLSLPSFNLLLAEFITNYIIGNSKYDYAKFATGITEFEVVTAGDSRHIAMANLFYQNFGADICRQIADHVNINTSANYYQNISETILCSSIIKIQRDIIRKQSELENLQFLTPGNGCFSPNKPKQTGDITDCEGHYEDCLGCYFYRPSEQELIASLENRRLALEEASKRILDVSTDIDKAFLDAHTTATRYRITTDINAKEMERKWRRSKNMN